MRKKLLKVFLCLFALIFISPLKTIGIENNNIQEIDLSLSGERLLFNTGNLKPGDTIIKKLLVTNSGKRNFDYSSSAKFLSGSKKLFDQIKLKIDDRKGEIYSGKLSNFNRLDPRFLASLEVDDLIFKIELPYELGNEYQGLNTEFEINFYIEGAIVGISPVSSPLNLPDTASSLYNILFLGIILFIFGAIVLLYITRNKLKNTFETE